MKLIPDWHKVLRKAWSIRLMLIAGALTTAEAIMPSLDGFLPDRALTIVSGLVIGAAFVARLIAQDGVSGDK